MFADLYAIARHTPLTILVTPKGEQLSVIVMPKPSGEAADHPALAKPIHAVGTPAELDAELPAALKAYAEKVNDLRAAIELPTEALDEAKAKAAKKDGARATRAQKKEARAKARADAAKKAAATRAARAEEKRKAAAAAAKKRADARAAKKAANITPPGKTAAAPAKSGYELLVEETKGVEYRSARKDASEAAATVKPAPVPRASRPGKAECIADYHRLHDEHGDRLTRRSFIKQAATGRRYEKLWQNWDAFVVEACSTVPAKSTPAGDPVETPTAGLLDAWPFPIGKKHIEEQDSGAPSAQGSVPPPPAEPRAAAPEPDAEDRDVYTEDGEYVSSITTDPRVGEKLYFASRPHPFRVVAIEGKRYTARAVLSVPRRIVDQATGEILGVSEEIYDIADAVAEIADKEFRVVAVDANQYLVKAAKARPPIAAATA